MVMNNHGAAMPMSNAERSARYRAKDVDAYRAKKREYATTPAQREQRRLYMQAWREANRDKHNQQARESHHRNKHKHVHSQAERHYLAKYGITRAEKLAMIDRQGGRCLICARSFTSSRATHVDHCHKTNRVRGILCHVCNTKLGWLEAYRDKIEDYLCA